MPPSSLPSLHSVRRNSRVTRSVGGPKTAVISKSYRAATSSSDAPCPSPASSKCIFALVFFTSTKQTDLDSGDVRKTYYLVCNSKRIPPPPPLPLFHVKYVLHPLALPNFLSCLNFTADWSLYGWMCCVFYGLSLTHEIAVATLHTPYRLRPAER